MKSFNLSNLLIHALVRCSVLLGHEHDVALRLHHVLVYHRLQEKRTLF